MALVKYMVRRPNDDPGPGVMRLLLKGLERRMERGAVTEVLLDLEDIADLKVMRDLQGQRYEVTEATPMARSTASRVRAKAGDGEE